MSTPYVAINYPILALIPQELGKLSNSLVAQAREVGFFKHAQKYSVPKIWRRSHQECIQRPHYSAMQQITASLLPFHE